MLVELQNDGRLSMKFTMKKQNLFDALRRMGCVATKGVRTDFDKAGQVTISAQSDKVTFLTTNGNLDAFWEVTSITDQSIQNTVSGKVTVDVSVASGIVKTLGGRDSEDHVIQVELDDQNLVLTDLDAKRNKKSSVAKMQVLSSHHDLKIKKPTSGFSYTFDSEIFGRAVGLISRYASPVKFRVEYQMICLHFLKDSVRMVCGDGMRFAVFSCEPEKNANIPKEQKYLLPVDQAGIIVSLLDGSPKIEITFESPRLYHVQMQNGMQLVLKGIPDETYISYEKHAYRQDEAQNIFDLDRKELSDAVALARSVRDKESEDQGGFLSVRFDAQEDGSWKCEVVDNKYRCEYGCPANLYSVGERRNFVSHYPAQYLGDLSSAQDSEVVRFFCLEENGTMIAAPVNLHSTNKDQSGAPSVIANPDGTNLSFFFAATTDDE